MCGTPFPHVHTYILHDQASPWCTQLQILDLPVLELDPLNIHLLLFDFPPAKRVLSTISSKSPRIYTIKKVLFVKRVRICKFSPSAHGLKSAVHGHAAVPTHIIHAALGLTDPLVVVWVAGWPIC